MTSISSDSTTAPGVPLTGRPIPPCGTVPDTGSRATAAPPAAEIIDLEWRITEHLQSGGGIWLTNGQYPSNEHIISVICHELASFILTPEPHLIELRPLDADQRSPWHRLGGDWSHEDNRFINVQNALMILKAAVYEGFVPTAEMRAQFLVLLGRGLSVRVGRVGRHRLVMPCLYPCGEEYIAIAKGSVGQLERSLPFRLDVRLALSSTGGTR